MVDPPRDPTADESNSVRNGAGSDARGAAPGDAHVALFIIGGIVMMFVVGFLILVISMARDWQ